MYDNLTRTNLEFAYQKAEKRIEKLETENNKLLDVINNQDVKIADLEKGNAKLKADYKVLSCSVGDFDELQEKLEEEQRKNNGLSDQLTKAKDLIEDMYDKIPASHSDYYKDVMERARQFIKEIEK